MQKPWPTKKTFRWKSETANETQELTVPIMYTDYHVSIYGEQESSFQVLTYLSGALVPKPGDSGNISVVPAEIDNIILPGDTMEMVLNFQTAFHDTAANTKKNFTYSLFSATVSKTKSSVFSYVSKCFNSLSHTFISAKKWCIYAILLWFGRS